MTTEEIEKTAQEYTCNLRGAVLKDVATSWFIVGAMYADSNWQEKTRWKSLLAEPPTNYTYDKMYLLRTESGSPYLVPLPYEESVKEFISCGFIEWKEIE